MTSIRSFYNNSESANTNAYKLYVIKDHKDVFEILTGLATNTIAYLDENSIKDGTQFIYLLRQKTNI